jgi:PAS domain S-box-containing protein
MDEWQKFINDNNVPVIVVNDVGIIVRVNSLFEKTFSWTSSELLGQPISTIIPINFEDAHNMGFSRYGRSGESTILNMPLDLEMLTGTGDVIVAQHFITTHRENGVNMFAAQIVLRNGE